ncbi:MAG TPA: hypothetical protein VHE61_15860 [Opitutaceae bacterium]|nr:hypothetical protein [Opitutaceae bacterium]
MIRPDQRLVRRWRGRIRTAVAASPRLRKERRRAKRRWTQDLTAHQFLRAFAPLLFLSGALSTPAGGDALVPAVAWWTLALTLIRATDTANALMSSPALWVFYHLPVENGAVFRNQIERVSRTTAWLVLDWIGFAMVAAGQHGTASAWLAAPFFAVGQAVMALSVAVLLARWRPRFAYGAIGVVMVVLLFVLLELTKNNAIGPASAGELFNAVIWVTPAGWLGLAYQRALLGEPSGWVIGLLLVAGAVVGLRAALRRMQRDFRLETVMQYGQPDEVLPSSAGAAIDEADSADDEPVDSIAAPPRPTPAAVVSLDGLRRSLDDALTAPPGLALFNRGWLESLVTRLLSVRQRMLVDFLQPRGPSWGRAWLITAGLIALAGLLHAAGLDLQWIVWLPVVGLVFFALPVFGGDWAGLKPVASSGGQMGAYAFLPVGFFQIVGTVCYINLLRSVLAFPLLVVAARYGYTVAPMPWPQALGVGGRLFVIILTVMPVWTVLAISKTTNDSSARWWFSAFVIGVIAIGLLAGISVGVVLFFVESPGALVACIGGMLAAVYGFVALYGYIWGRAVFDLIGKLPTR